MGGETEFRRSRIIPFLKTLKNTAFFPIQQLAILGDADFIVCIRGRFLWLELKDWGEDLRPLQEFKASEVRRAGGIAIKCSPENWAKVKVQLTLLDAGEI